MKEARAWAVVGFATAMVAVAVALLPAGVREGPHDGVTSAGRVLGQLGLALLLASLATSGRRRRRVDRVDRAHAVVGTLVLLLSVAHLALLLVRGLTYGWLSGAIALGLLGAHGAMGAAKARLVTRWGHAQWRFAHLATGLAALALSLEHALLYGRHLGVLGELVGGP